MNRSQVHLKDSTVCKHKGGEEQYELQCFIYRGDPFFYIDYYNIILSFSTDAQYMEQDKKPTPTRMHEFKFFSFYLFFWFLSNIYNLNQTVVGPVATGQECVGCRSLGLSLHHHSVMGHCISCCDHWLQTQTSCYMSQQVRWQQHQKQISSHHLMRVRGFSGCSLKEWRYKTSYNLNKEKKIFLKKSWKCEGRESKLS